MKLIDQPTGSINGIMRVFHPRIPNHQLEVLCRETIDLGVDEDMKLVMKMKHSEVDEILTGVQISYKKKNS